MFTRRIISTFDRRGASLSAINRQSRRRDAIWVFEAENALSGQAETLIQPARNTTDHLFYRPPQLGQANGGLFGAIAVGAGAIHHKERIGWIFFEGVSIDAWMRQVDGAFNVALSIKFLATDIQQNKVLAIVGDGVMNIPAIRFEFE